MEDLEGRSSSMCGVRPMQVVVLLPFGQMLFQVDIAFVFEQLVEFSRVGPMRTFHLSIEARGARLDVDMIDPQVLQVPMKPGLELMAVVGTDRADTERKLSADVIDELDGVGLGVTAVDLQGSNARSVIDGCELIALDLAREGKKLDIDLHMVSRDLLFIPFHHLLGHDGAFVDGTGQPLESMPGEGAAHSSFGDFHPVVALQVPGNTLGAEVIGTSQVEDFFLDLRSGTPGGFRGPGLRLIRPFSPSLRYCLLQQ